MRIIRGAGQLEHSEYLNDIKRIQRVAIEHGFDITLYQAENLWSIYSSSMDASWLHLPKSDEEVWLNISVEI